MFRPRARDVNTHTACGTPTRGTVESSELQHCNPQINQERGKFGELHQVHFEFWNWRNMPMEHQSRYLTGWTRDLGRSAGTEPRVSHPARPFQTTGLFRYSARCVTALVAGRKGDSHVLPAWTWNVMAWPQL